MHTVLLPVSGMVVSRLVLGLGGLHHLNSRKDREGLIGEAVDLGVNHFDSARLYGDGLADLTLGRALAAHPDVSVTTKFGLSGMALMGRLGTAALPLRAGRQLAQRLRLSRWPHQDHSLRSMQRSLEASLRALRRERVEVFMVHEPSQVEEGLMLEVIDALHRLRAEGKVAHVGVAGARAQEASAQHPGAFDVVQTSEAEWDEAGAPPDLTYGVISAARGVHSAAALRRAAARRPAGALILGTTKTAHLRSAVRALAE